MLHFTHFPRKAMDGFALCFMQQSMDKTRMLAINVSVPNLTVAGLEQFRTLQLRIQRKWPTDAALTENKPSFIRNPHVVISRQNPFAANVVPKLVAMATSLRPAISAMSHWIACPRKPTPIESNSVSLTIIQLKLYPIESQKVVAMALATSLSCRVSTISAFCQATTQTPSITNHLVAIVHTKLVIAILVQRLVVMTTSLGPSFSAMSSSDSLTPKTYP